VLKALAKEPSARYASARAIADDLRRSSTTSRSRRDAWAPPSAPGGSAAVTPWCRAHSRVVALLVVVAAGAHGRNGASARPDSSPERAQSDLKRAWADMSAPASSVESIRRRSTASALPTRSLRPTRRARPWTRSTSGSRPSCAARAAGGRGRRRLGAASALAGDPDRLLDVGARPWRARWRPAARSLGGRPDDGLALPRTLAGRSRWWPRDDPASPRSCAGRLPRPGRTPREPPPARPGPAVEGHEPPSSRTCAHRADGRRALSVGQDGTQGSGSRGGPRATPVHARPGGVRPGLPADGRRSPPHAARRPGSGT